MFYKLKNDKRGMTLIEMIISLVILSILMTSTMGMLTSSISIFTSTSMAALDKMVGNSVFNTIENAAKYATHMKLVDRGTAVDESEYVQKISIENLEPETDSGKLWYKMDGEASSVNLFSDDFYMGRTVQYKIQKVGSDHKHIKLSVTVYREGEPCYARDGVIKCVNLGLLKSGVSSNEIDDKGLTKDSESTTYYNQDIYFTADELLISGGETAWAIEYKLQEYLNKYNRILGEYYGKLGIAQSLVAEVNNESVAGRVVEESVLREALSLRQKAIFGADGSYYNPNVASDALADGDDINGFYNLRKYYQEKIYNLLKFSPMSTYGNLQAENIYCGGTGKNVQNPYYGVIATKEQLYTGFLLTYYDENGDGQVTQKEMPRFTNPNTMFAGTMFANNNYADKMTILGHLRDSSADVYTNLIGTTTRTIKFFTTGALDTTNFTWTTGSAGSRNWRNITGAADSLTYTTTQDSYISNGGTGKRGYSIESATSNISYDYDDSLTGEDFLGGITTKTSMFGKLPYTAAQAGAATVSKLGATRLSGSNCAVTATGKSYYGGYSGSASTKFVIKPNANLTEGWYYVLERYDLGKNTLDSNSTSGSFAYHFFYLEAATSEASPDNNIAVAAGRSIEIYSSSWSIDPTTGGYRYQQAKILEAGNDSVSTGSENMFTYNINQHSYNDYILYAVDWDSWFGTSTGLLNGLINSFASWLKSAIWKDTTWSITSVRGDNANQSLGRTGQFNVNNMGGSDRSYQYAWAVYNQNRGTWYYLPTGSNALNSALSGNSWYSAKNNPTSIDVSAWSSSSQMNWEIDNRKMSTGILFGLATTQYDALWVALPVNQTVSGEDVMT